VCWEGREGDRAKGWHGNLEIRKRLEREYKVEIFVCSQMVGPGFRRVYWPPSSMRLAKSRMIGAAWTVR
jgi:hypothetical protein